MRALPLPTEAAMRVEELVPSKSHLSDHRYHPFHQSQLWGSAASTNNFLFVARRALSAAPLPFTSDHAFCFAESRRDCVRSKTSCSSRHTTTLNLRGTQAVQCAQHTMLTKVRAQRRPRPLPGCLLRVYSIDYLPSDHS